jgi:hypothetical protein
MLESKIVKRALWALLGTILLVAVGAAVLFFVVIVQSRTW